MGSNHCAGIVFRVDYLRSLDLVVEIMLFHLGA